MRRPKTCPACRAATLIGAVAWEDRWVPVLRCLECRYTEPVRRRDQKSEGGGR